MSKSENLIDFGDDCCLLIPNSNNGEILSPKNVLTGEDIVSEKRNSLDNNPFDHALKKVNVQYDPFENVFEQAQELERASSQSVIDVLTVDLLGLGGEETKVNENMDISSCCAPEGIVQTTESQNQLTTVEEQNDEFPSNLSPIVKGNTTRRKSSLENGIKTNARLSSTLIHGPMDIRTQLLKLSVTGSPVESPVRRGSVTSEDSASTPDRKSSNLRLSSNELNDSCIDINSISLNLVDSETEQDSDLELMKIPMLQKLDKDAGCDQLPNTFSKKEHTDSSSKPIASNENDNKVSKAIDLEMIREKVRRHKLEKINTNDVDDLISSMKQIVLDCGSEDQKSEANRLLESLSTLFARKLENNNDQENIRANDELEVPQPIIRQGTFDLGKSRESRSFVVNGEATITSKEHVYDEEIEVSEATNNELDAVAPDVTSIFEQLGKLLGNQNVSVVQANLGAGDTQAMNPTYIVVMGTPTTPLRQNTQIIINNPTSPEFEPQPRNRSHSLSLHDKPVKTRTLTTPKSPSVFNTPTRSQTLRRTSNINFSPTAARKLNSRTDSGAGQKSATLQRRQSLNTERDLASSRIYSKNISNLKIDSNSRNLKFKTSENTRRTVGPLKATVPITNVPKLATSLTKKSINSNHLVPMGPAACSTPSARSPPGLVKRRHSFRGPSLSSPPKSKDNPGKATLGGVSRRRSLTDSKSPQKYNMSAPPTRMSIARKPMLGGVSRNYGLVPPKNKENAPPK